MFRHHIWEFVLAVWNHSIVLLAGVISLAIGIFERIRKKAITGRVLTIIGVIVLFVACFLAWQDERVKIERLDVLSVEPYDLVSLYKYRTESQGKALTQTYIDKWIEVSGSVAEVRVPQEHWFGTAGQLSVNTMSSKPNHPADAVATVNLDFTNKKSIRALQALSQGEKIQARGQVKKIGREVVDLENCEILEVSAKQ